MYVPAKKIFLLEVCQSAPAPQTKTNKLSKKTQRQHDHSAMRCPFAAFHRGARSLLILCLLYGQQTLLLGFCLEMIVDYVVG